MGLPVRLVCIDCLQSVEVTGSATASQPEVCPHCGAFLDPFQAGIESRAGIDLASSETVEISEASTRQSLNPLIGPDRQIGRFEIRLSLGEGGYGQVFRAYDPHLDREVALKVLKPNRLGEKAMKRFLREARAAARLEHPHIVGLYEAGLDEGRCWIAYQLVVGQTLAIIRDLARPSVIESVRIVRDLALGLHHAHSRGVFHRDLKPANIIIDEEGRPRLTDFGLARREDIESDLTTEGTVLGTPQYMSPEAAAGRAHEADARSDIYSLGVILYELICGRRPCDVPSGSPLWRAVHHVTPPTPRSVDRAVPPLLDRICMKALALNPEDRYASADLLAAALTEQIEKYRPARASRRSTESFNPIARPRFRRWSRAAAALGFLSITLATAALSVPRPTWPDRPEPAVDLASVRPTMRTVPTRDIQSYAASAERPTTFEDVAPVSTVPNVPDPAAAVVEVGAPGPKPFVGNTDSKSKKFHHSSCRYADQIRFKAYFESAAAAADAGYTPCSTCKHKY